MKKRITKIWSIGLIVALLASLMVITAPASAADALRWNEESTPSASGEVLVPGLDIYDISVNPDGETIYAVGRIHAQSVGNSDNAIYKSTNGGSTWSDISDATGLPAAGMFTHFVACAPDDPDLVVVVDGTPGQPEAYVSDDGGVEFNTLDFPVAAVTSISDVDVSAAASGKNFVAISGVNAAGLAEIWYRNLGLGGWVTAAGLSGFNTGDTGIAYDANDALAVAFSPNFASDQVLTAVIVNAANTTFEMMMVSVTSANSTWNEAAGFTNYPVTIEDADGAQITAPEGASIALAPTYLGGDEVERVAFVGIDDNGADDPDMGVYRLEDYTDRQVMGGYDIHSVAYDGVTCLAGQTNTTVWRSSDPLSTIPTFYNTATTKAPGGTVNATLAWLGTSAVAATTGDESAFALSADDGKSFNDISLIDTTIDAIIDVAVSADGEKVYMATDNGTEVSVWRQASDWVRVLTITATANNWLVRIAPDDPDVVFIAEMGGKGLYYSKEGGDTKWYSRRASQNIQDMAVESDDVAYIAQDNSKAVMKTTNSGFTWGAGEDTKLAGGNIHTITSLAEDQLLVGSDEGYVSYSTDGNDSWSKISKQVYAGDSAIQVSASGLETGDFIFAAGGIATDNSVMRWTIGQASSEEWKSLENAGVTGSQGLILTNGWLYTLGMLYFERCPDMNWTSDDPGAALWGVPFVDANHMFMNAIAAPVGLGLPSALRISTSDTTIKLWAIDTPNAEIYSLMDTMALAVPTLDSPADGTKVQVNPISGDVYNVALSWPRMSKELSYMLVIGLSPIPMTNVVAGPLFPEWAAGPSTSIVVGPTSADWPVPFNPGTTYYWYLQAFTPLSSSFSAPRSLVIESVGTSELVPEIGAPANGGTVSETPAFSWSPVGGAAKYRFELSTDTVFAVPLYTVDVVSTGVQPDIPLDLGTYFWRVKALEPIEGEWSTIANFTVAEPVEAVTPEIVIPEQEAPVVNIPEIVVPTPEVVVQEAPEEPAISEGLLWAVIIIGAVLVIALIVLIVRTRRSV